VRRILQKLVVRFTASPLTVVEFRFGSARSVLAPRASRQPLTEDYRVWAEFESDIRVTAILTILVLAIGP
jgi:hypothetical protein